MSSEEKEIDINLTYEGICKIQEAMAEAESDGCIDPIVTISVKVNKKTNNKNICCVVVHGTCTTEYSTGNIW